MFTNERTTELNELLSRLIDGSGTDNDYQKLSNLLQNNQNMMQLSKFNVNISEGKNIYNSKEKFY